MTQLTQEFVDSCPVEEGFRMRGLEMTRIEVFVDAAFAFALTMLVISFDSIPTNFAETLIAIKGIPAFVMSVFQLVWIWYTHNKWSRRYGLDNAQTVVLSAALLIVVLVYIYPMRILNQGFFSWVSGDYLSSDFRLTSWDELAGMFVFLGAGWIALCLIYVRMYRYAGSLKQELLLNDFESHETRTLQYMWIGSAGCGVLSIALALTLQGPLVPYSGVVYVLLLVWIPLIRRLRRIPGTR